jgi:hypothetical protein
VSAANREMVVEAVDVPDAPRTIGVREKLV